MKLKKNNYASGFTLLEVLLGLTVFAVIAVSLYSTFSSALQLQRRAQLLNRTYREANWSLGRIAKDLENMRPYDFTGSYSDKAAFVGKRDRLMLLSATEHGLKVVSYYIALPEDAHIHSVVIGKKMSKNEAVTFRRTQEAEKAAFLVREVSDFADFLSDRVDEESRDIEILSSRILTDGLKFRYAYEPSGTDQAIDWREEWTKKYTPAGVQVEMTLLSLAGTRMPFARDVFIPTGAWGTGEK